MSAAGSAGASYGVSTRTISTTARSVSRPSNERLLVGPFQERAVEVDDLAFGIVEIVEIVDEDVEVRLLGWFPRGPVGRAGPDRGWAQARSSASQPGSVPLSSVTKVWPWGLVQVYVAGPARS